MTSKQIVIDAKIFMVGQLIEETQRTLKMLISYMELICKMQAEIARVNQED